MDNTEESFYFSDGAESLDSLDQEELEIALYSQIHFEPNTQLSEVDNVKFENEFDICVEGNENTESKTSLKNSDVVLDKELKGRYEKAVANAYIGVDSDSDDSAMIIEDSFSDVNDDIQINTNSNTPAGRYMYTKVASGSDDENNDSDPWAINMEDSTKGGFQYGRYHKPVKCHNCNKTGHLSKNCPQPKKIVVCSMCSEEGHICRTCPSSFCYNCEEQGHGASTCRGPRGMWRRICKRCKMQGHGIKNCPELWRQYHITTMPGKLQQLKIPKRKRKKSCFNCGERGHYGHECEEDRFTRFLQINSPFITRYEPVKEFLDVMRLSDRSDVVYEDAREIISESKRKIFEEKNTGQNKDRKPSEYLHILKKSGKTGRNNFDKMSFTIKNSNFETFSDIYPKKRKQRKSRENKRNNVKVTGQNYDSSIVDNKGKRSLTLPGGGKKTVLPIDQPDEDFPRNFKSDIPSERDQQSSDLGQYKCESNATISVNENLDEPPRKKGRTVSYKNSADEMTINVNVTPVKNVTKVFHRDNQQLKKNEKRNFTSEDVFSVHSIDMPGTSEEIKHGKEPKVNRKEPKVNRKEPKVNRKKPKVNRKEPKVNRKEPFVNRKEPNVNRKEPKVNRKEPKVKISNKHRSHRNDKFASGDLFSLQKIMKTKNSSYLEDYVEEDVNHQVHRNEWWNKNKRKNARKKNNKKSNARFLKSTNSS